VRFAQRQELSTDIGAPLLDDAPAAEPMPPPQAPRVAAPGEGEPAGRPG
jgi:hypothetical protein